ncbi:class IIb bacteriocin, lactobin A/cerein 7B family [Halonatronum saccharophilum]|nr:class IIb bacteriocin, lactobin A/cerein 7B family [Halonatronum saccharophilum]
MKTLDNKELMNIDGGVAITKGALLVAACTGLGFIGGCAAGMTE